MNNIIIATMACMIIVLYLGSVIGRLKKIEGKIDLSREYIRELGLDEDTAMRKAGFTDFEHDHFIQHIYLGLRS